MHRALTIDEAAFGQDHPMVAIRLNNLAILLQDTEPLMRRAFAIVKEVLGANHPITRTVQNSLTRLLAAIAVKKQSG